MVPKFLANDVTVCYVVQSISSDEIMPNFFFSSILGSSHLGDIMLGSVLLRMSLTLAYVCLAISGVLSHKRAPELGGPTSADNALTLFILTLALVTVCADALYGNGVQAFIDSAGRSALASRSVKFIPRPYGWPLLLGPSLSPTRWWRVGKHLTASFELLMGLSGWPFLQDGATDGLRLKRLGTTAKRDIVYRWW